MNWSSIIESIVGLAKKLIPLFCFYKLGTKTQENKQLKQEAKQNEKHNKNRKLIANMSDDELLKFLHKK